jgi:cobalt-zinc-cadmium efflux system protein
MAHEHVRAGLKHRRALVLALAINAAFMVVEAVAGFLSGSLVLIADAGHMLTDVAGVSAALLAIWLAQRPANKRKTYGYYRTEILAALANAVLLYAVSAYILYEAWQRWRDPPDVPGATVLVVACIGLVANLAGALLLMRGAGEDLNVRGAFLDMIADVLGSLGAITAGIVILTTGWRYADPLLAAAVGVAILPRTWGLLKSALDVLLEGTPAHIELQDVQSAMLAQPRVESVHDLHVWTVTSGFIALSGHVQVRDNVDRDALLVALRSTLASRFDIDHVTIQVEDERLSSQLEQPCFPEVASWDGLPRTSQAAHGHGGGD